MRYAAFLTVGFVLALGVAPAAQNRAETQILLELRTLQEQVQRMQLALNQVTERVKDSDARMDAQANDMRKGFADQKGSIELIATGQRTLAERGNENAVRVAQLSQEMKAIREGLTIQQSLLNDIVNLLQPLSAAALAAAGTDPAAATPPGAAGAPPATTVAAPKPGAAIPPSPTAYYNTAFGFYYNNQFELAVDALGEALTRFPDATEAARAQLTIGDAYYQMGKRFQEALTAYTAVIAKYKDPDVVPDAYYKQGLTYEQLGQNEAARKSYQQVITLYKDSSAAIQAGQRLKIIK